MKHTFTRQQLYELAWKQPMRDLAATIGISDVALAKACRRLNIPLPGRGYWAKVAAGHSLTRIPLLPDAHGRSEVRFDARPPTPRPVPLEQLAKTSAATEKDDVDSPTPSLERIEISDLSKPHPLTRRVRSGLKSRTTDSRELHFALPASGWKVAVSADSIERALVIFDSVCGALKSIGAVVREGTKEPWQDEVPKAVYLDDEPIHFAIREHAARHRRTARELAQRKAAGDNYPRAIEYRPSGILVAAIPNAPYGAIQEWRDSKSSSLEDQIPAIVSALAAMPTVFKNARREKETREKAHRDEEHKRWKMEERIRRNKERLAELLAEARRLDERASIIAYLDHLEREMAQQGWLPTEKLKKGLAKARELAAGLDPTEKRVALLQSHGLVTEAESRWYHGNDDEEA